MKRIAVALFILVFLASYGSPATAYEDTWTSPDKKKHFAVSMASGFMVRSIFPGLPWQQRYAVALVPGLLKEVTDPVFSYKDMTYNVLGVIAGDYLNGVIVNYSDKTVSVSYATSF